MAFNMQTPQPNMAGLGSLIEGSNPLNVMGRTMSELDKLIDQRRGEEYYKNLDPEQLKTVEGSMDALRGAAGMGDKVEGMLQKNVNNNLLMEKYKNEQKKATMDALINRNKYLTAQNKENREQGLYEIKKAEEERKKNKIEVEKMEAKEAARTRYNNTTRGMAIIDRVLNNDELNDVLGPIDSLYPDFMRGENEKSAIEDLKTLRSKAFLENAGAIKGALSEAEGEKLEKALVSLQTSQDEEVIRENLRYLKTLFAQTAGVLKNQYGFEDISKGFDPSNITLDTVIPQSYKDQGYKKMINPKTGKIELRKSGR